MSLKNLVNDPICGAIMISLIIIGGGVILGFIVDLGLNGDESQLYKWFSKLHEFNKRVLKKLKL